MSLRDRIARLEGRGSAGLVTISITGGMPSPRGAEHAKHFARGSHDIAMTRFQDEGEHEFIERAHVDATSRGSSFLIIGGLPEPKSHHEFTDGLGDSE